MIQRPYLIMVNNNNMNGATIDATQTNTISWSLSGDISTSFDVQIYDNSTGTLAFDSTQITSYAISYVLQPNSGSVVNGKQYKVTITVYNSTGQSATSYSQIFNTATTPTVTLSSIDSPVANATYTFDATYSQAQNESMVSWISYLYDNNKNLIGQSNIQTSTKMEYAFTGLQSGDSYYVEFQATSSSGLTGTTGLVAFNVQYGQPTVSLNLTATNNVDDGTISLAWSVYQIIGSTDDSNLEYLTNGGVNLTDGKNVWFNNGFNVDSSFSCKIWLTSPVHNSNLVIFTGDNGTITLQYEGDKRFHLRKTITGCSKVTHIFSDECNSTYTNVFFGNQVAKRIVSDQMFVFIQQVGNDLNIIAQSLIS